jgi:hypothetical protein
MNRFLFIPLIVSALAALCLADEPASVRVSDARIRQLERNQALLEKFVQGGVDLAKAGDRLKRADYCHDLVKSLAAEIKQAAKDHDGDRALELGRHLQDLLERGVAGNLSKESRQIPSGSTYRKSLETVRNQTCQTIDELEEDLKKSASGGTEDIQETLEVIQKGQTTLAEVIFVKNRK